MFDSTGERGPPCGVPSSLGLTSPFSITPACKNARISFSKRLSLTLSAIFASNRSWLTRWWVGTGLATMSLVPVPPRRTRRADFPQRAPQVALVGGPSNRGMECRHCIRYFKPGFTQKIGPVEPVPLTPSSQRTGPLPLYLSPDPVKLPLAVMQSKLLVEAAQHHHELLLLIPPLPMPMLAEPLLGFGQELSAAFVAWDPHQG